MKEAESILVVCLNCALLMLKNILLLVKLMMQVSCTILWNVTKTQNLTMDVKNSMMILKRIGPR